MADETRTTPHTLARQILQQLETNTGANAMQSRTAASEAASTLLATNLDGLIALYFACEDADERDIVFERLVALEPIETHDFFDAMMHQDEDDFMRVAAASVLIARGHAGAVDTLLLQLQAGGDVALFEQALAGLVVVPGIALYPVLVTIWQDPTRESAERRAAMLGMETVDPEQASLAMVRFIDTLQDLRRFPDDQLEVAMAMLARQPQQAALEALQRLLARVAAMPCPDADAQEDRLELLGFVREGFDLVHSALAPA